jgi:hypothetical protein
MTQPTIIGEVEICNSGLLKVGAEQISSLEDDTRASNICQAMFPILRDEVMRAVPWRFALSQVNLPLVSGTPPVFGYQAAYDIPSNLLRVWQVNASPWTQIGQQILCDNANGINVLAIARNLNAQSWDAQFAEALAWRIAMEIALALVQSTPLKQEMEKGYQQALAAARSTNAVIGTPERLIADFWSRSRKYGFNRGAAIDAGAPELYDTPDQQ